MGNCFSAKPGNRVKTKGALQSTEKQGAKELKQNYKIDSDTKVLGSGAFGKVFLTHNKHNVDH